MMKRFELELLYPDYRDIRTFTWGRDYQEAKQRVIETLADDPNGVWEGVFYKIKHNLQK